VNVAVEAASDAFQVASRDIYSTSHAATATQARQVAMYLLRQYGGYSFPEIGRMLKRDHSTAQSAMKRVEVRRKTDPTFARKLVQAERSLKTPLPSLEVRADTSVPVNVTLRGGVPVRICIIVAPDGSYAAFGSSRYTAEEATAAVRQNLDVSSATEVWLDLDVHLPKKEPS